MINLEKMKQNFHHCITSQGDGLHPTVERVRDTLQRELIRRFETEEREGHKEDLLVATILDPR